jgi:ADP-ribosylglycohydrolase
MNKITAKQVEAVLLGVAVGDALGVPVEFLARGTFRIADMTGYGTHNQPAGTWSDDTSLTLCLADAMARDLTAAGIVDQTAKNLIRWFDKAEFTAHGTVFDIGISTSKAIRNLKAGMCPGQSGCADVNENCNGSLMRIAPLVFYAEGKSQAERFDIVRQVSSITHAHPVSILACIIYVEYMIELLKGRNRFTAFEATQKQIMDALTKGELNNYFHNEITDYFMPLIFPGHKWHLVDEGDIQSGGFVVDTLKAAIWCFLTTDNYRNAVLKAVNLGSDTDTTAAVTGALAGLYYEIDGIPAEWREKVARLDALTSISGRVAKHCI